MATSSSVMFILPTSLSHRFLPCRPIHPRFTQRPALPACCHPRPPSQPCLLRCVSNPTPGSRPRLISKLAISLSLSVALTLSPHLAVAQEAHHDHQQVASIPTSKASAQVVEDDYQLTRIERLVTPSFARRHPLTALSIPDITDSSDHTGSHLDDVDNGTVEIDDSGINIDNINVTATGHEENTSNVENINSKNSTSSTKESNSSAAHGDGHVSLGDKLARRLRAVGVPDALIVFTLSALPVLELRAGVPAGFLLGLPPRDTFLLSVVGNLCPILPFLLLLRLSWVQALSRRVLGRARALAQTVGNAQSRATALALFVGVPLPGTGAWTGSLVAFVLGMPLSSTMAALSSGVVMAATIMTALCALGWIGASIAAIVLGSMGIVAMMRACSNRGSSTTGGNDGDKNDSGSA